MKFKYFMNLKKTLIFIISKNLNKINKENILKNIKICKI